MSEASCAQTDPELFFPETDSYWKAAQAKKVCASCPVILECLEYAQVNAFREGIWGGLSANERYRLVKKRKEAS
jgi:WhiB family redox-sensing transcriptional regulator